MNNFFKRPYRETGSKKSKLLTILAFGLFIFLFLFIFRPFGLSQLQMKTLQLMAITLGFGLITSFILVVYKFLIEPVVIGDKWTLGKNLLWDILIASSIGAANYCYICIIFHLDFMPLYLFYGVWTAILVGIIPVTVSHILVYNKMYRNALREAAVPDEKIFWEEEVKITAGYARNEFIINPRHIIYLCSNDNYVTIVTIKENIQNKTTIRGTLKSAEEELGKNSRFVRCHKCYIVNLDYAEKVTGNNQNMKIKLTPSGTEIPVARSKAEEVVKRFEKK